MIALNPTDLARVKALTNQLYPYLHPAVRTYMNEDLLAAKAYWEVDEWIERMQLTLDFYQGKVPQGVGGITRTKRKSKERHLS